ncbi:hypothetical protein P7B02_07475 [Caulobacter segnis]|uniref:hypothetical protein n=1 Tax=Caulobacter segnis TaxID=88688 RepID=UPI00240F7788|nr:hypothetical protein [Caulobacter segnis]MDG2521378.1 hypothetical protein [Caulobacter segnis]
MAEDKTPETYGEDGSYDPTTPQANRSIQQGAGVGARDLRLQADPTREPGLPDDIKLEEEAPSLSDADRDEAQASDERSEVGRQP